jgi:hypothetical protein
MRATGSTNAKKEPLEKVKTKPIIRMQKTENINTLLNNLSLKR